MTTDVVISIPPVLVDRPRSEPALPWNLADIDVRWADVLGTRRLGGGAIAMDADVFLDPGLGDRAKVGAGVVGGSLSAGGEARHLDRGLRLCPGPVVRVTARPSDVVAVSGTLGYSPASISLRWASIRVEQLGDLAPFIETYRAPGLRWAPAWRRGAGARHDGPSDAGPRLMRRASPRASGVVIEFDRDAIEAEASTWPAAPRLRGRSCAVGSLQGREHGMIAVFRRMRSCPTASSLSAVRACRAEEEQAMMDGAVLRGRGIISRRIP